MSTDDLANPDHVPSVPKPRHFSLLRAFSSADLITMGNAASGMAAIYASLAYLKTGSRNEMWAALVLPFEFRTSAIPPSASAVVILVESV